MIYQNFKNHARYYILHHFVAAPLSIIILFSSSYLLTNELDDLKLKNPIVILFLLSILNIIQLIISRVYALKNQDRIIRLEIRQRYFEVTGKSFIPLEKKLRMSQIVALRFASNDEMVGLIEKTINGKFRSKQIKSLVKDWQIDNNRV